MPVLALLLLLAAPKQGTEKGIVPLDIVDVGRLKIGFKGGTPEEALAVWVEGHRLQKAGDDPAACAKYLDFLAMAGHRSLPARYEKMARDRVEKLHDPVRKRFEEACKAYPNDRAAGVAIWKDLAAKWPMLPEGYASLQLWQSDALREAVDRAKQLRDEGKKKEAIAPLEEAVRALPRGLYRYEATTLLFDLGGPDLRPKSGSGGPGDDADGKKSDDKKDDGESEIEIND